MSPGGSAAVSTNSFPREVMGDCRYVKLLRPAAGMQHQHHVARRRVGQPTGAENAGHAVVGMEPIDRLSADAIPAYVRQLIWSLCRSGQEVLSPDGWLLLTETRSTPGKSGASLDSYRRDASRTNSWRYLGSRHCCCHVAYGGLRHRRKNHRRALAQQERRHHVLRLA